MPADCPRTACGVAISPPFGASHVPFGAGHAPFGAGLISSPIPAPQNCRLCILLAQVPPLFSGLHHLCLDLPHPYPDLRHPTTYRPHPYPDLPHTLTYLRHPNTFRHHPCPDLHHPKQTCHRITKPGHNHPFFPVWQQPKIIKNRFFSKVFTIKTENLFRKNCDTTLFANDLLHGVVFVSMFVIGSLSSRHSEGRSNPSRPDHTAHLSRPRPPLPVWT